VTFALLFGYSERVWDTIVILFVIIPAVMLWALTLVSIVRRPDLVLPWKIGWCFAMVLFPIVATIIYWLRRPTVVVTEQQAAGTTANVADAVDAISDVLENLVVTITIAETTVTQGAGMLRDVADVLEKTGDTIGFTVPLTKIRPLSGTYTDVRRFTTRSRSLAASLAHMAKALGANTTDLRRATSQVRNVSRSMRRASRIPIVGGMLAGGEPALTPPSAQIPLPPEQSL
jgi:hypothetical protein